MSTSIDAPILLATNELGKNLVRLQSLASTIPESQQQNPFVLRGREKAGRANKLHNVVRGLSAHPERIKPAVVRQLCQLFSEAAFDLTYPLEETLVEADFLPDVSARAKISELLSVFDSLEGWCRVHGRVCVEESARALPPDSDSCSEVSAGGAAQESARALPPDSDSRDDVAVAAGEEIAQCLRWRGGALRYMHTCALLGRGEVAAVEVDDVDDGIFRLEQMLLVRRALSSDEVDRSKLTPGGQEVESLLRSGIYSSNHVLAMMYCGELAYWRCKHFPQAKTVCSWSMLTTPVPCARLLQDSGSDDVFRFFSNKAHHWLEKYEQVVTSGLVPGWDSTRARELLGEMKEWRIRTHEPS